MDIDNAALPDAGEVRELMGDPTGAGTARCLPDVEYARPDGQPLHIQLLLPLLPWYKVQPAAAPLVVFVQGSSWRTQKVYAQLPQLSQLARAGFVVASVQHRSSLTAPFPACLIDVKSAIRFLRAHAAEYAIDPERVAIWGTSSGGNLALLTALTAGDDRYEAGEHLEQTSRVNAVVSCFGPTDLCEMMRLAGVEMSDLAGAVDHPFYTLIGGVEGDAQARMEAVSPMCRLREGMELPPHLLLHGDEDGVVPYAQSHDYWLRLRQLGCDADMVRVRGAAHEDRFWTAEVLSEIERFLIAHI